MSSEYREEDFRAAIDYTDEQIAALKKMYPPIPYSHRDYHATPYPMMGPIPSHTAGLLPSDLLPHEPLMIPLRREMNEAARSMSISKAIDRETLVVTVDWEVPVTVDSGVTKMGFSIEQLHSFRELLNNIVNSERSDNGR